MRLRRATTSDGSPIICGAKTRQQTACQGQPMPNGRCRMHGGSSNVGIAVATFKHGRHSKYLPQALLASYQAALADEQRLELIAEMAVVDALIDQLLPRVLEPGAAGERARTELGAQIDRRVRLVASERRRMIDLQQYITKEQAMGFVDALVKSVKRHVTDPATLRGISADLARLLGTSADG